MLQFSENDTIRWAERFGNKSEGNHTYSGTTEFDNPRTTFVGTIATSTSTVGSNSGFVEGDIVLIHQTRNGGDGAGNWQLNVITNIAGTTFTFKYPLQHDFDTTAQIIKVLQHEDITVTGTLNAPAWNGTSGGIIVLMGESIDGGGTVNLNITGYRAGGAANNNQNGQRGEGTNTAQGSQANNQRDQTAGGGGIGNVSFGGGGGGGGGHAVQANNGASGGTNAGGQGGFAGGLEDMTIAVFGGAGGGGGAWNLSAGGTPGVGGRSGGLFFCFVKNQDFSAMTISSNGGNGTNAGGAGGDRGGGGGGSGGGILLKGQEIILTTNITALNGTNGTGQGSGGNGGIGSVGRVRAEFSKIISGDSNPSASVFQDKIFNDPPRGGFMLAMVN